MNPSRKRPFPSRDATPETAASCTSASLSRPSEMHPTKKPKHPPMIQTTKSGIALPQRVPFDPYNSSATGHQRAENRLSGSTGWRDSRNAKLREQYLGGRGGGKRVADLVGAGSEDFGKERVVRERGQRSLFECRGLRDARGDREGEVRERSVGDDSERLSSEDALQHDVVEAPVEEVDEDLERAIAASLRDQATEQEAFTIPPSHQPDDHSAASTARSEAAGNGSTEDKSPPQIFSNLVFYLNGSTAPLMSDHRLRYLVTAHGGAMSLSHTRKTVTHVIVGKPNDGGAARGGGGAGGALAATKIQREVVRSRGKGVKFVGAEWVVECVRRGRRVAEGRYEIARGVRGAGQGSVWEGFGVTKPGGGGGCGKVSQVYEGDVTDEEGAA